MLLLCFKEQLGILGDELNNSYNSRTEVSQGTQILTHYWIIAATIFMELQIINTKSPMNWNGDVVIQPKTLNEVPGKLLSFQQFWKK